MLVECSIGVQLTNGVKFRIFFFFYNVLSLSITVTVFFVCSCSMAFIISCSKTFSDIE